METFDVIKKYSLVNIYQCWELWSLIEQTGKIEGDVLEIGVYRGASSAIMGRRIKLLDQASRLLCCDTFEGVVKASQNDNFYKGGEYKDTSPGLVTELLVDKLKIENVTILKGVFPDDTAQAISENRFRLSHVDVDTYQSAKDRLDWVWPRLNVGGALVLSDYGYPRIRGITKLVDERKGQQACLFIHNLNGNAILVKIKE